MRIFNTLVLVAAAASQVGSTDCNGDAIRDSGFDLWCGDSLCAWKVETGSIEEVPTWHAGDEGVELVGDDAAIEQLSPIASSDGTCIEFDLIANVDADVDAELNVDVFGDGSIETSERLPTGTWQPLMYQLRMPDNYAGVRFEIVKHGSGNVELANIGAKVVTGCDDQPALVVNSRPLGAPCDGDGECTSGICSQTPVLAPFGIVPVCVACDADHACTGGEVCGLDAPVSPVRAVPAQCEVAASHELGEQCITGAECASGVCTANMCSTCATNADCTGGDTCQLAWGDLSAFDVAASECAPHLGHRGSGEPCVSNDDCASGTCDGTALSTCWDGRPCATDADCPFTDLQNTACTAVGVQGGSCD
jgi:hypothetical protein